MVTMVKPVEEVQSDMVAEGEQLSFTEKQPEEIKTSVVEDKLKEETEISADVVQVATGGEKPKLDDTQPSEVDTEVICYKITVATSTHKCS